MNLFLRAEFQKCGDLVACPNSILLRMKQNLLLRHLVGVILLGGFCLVEPVRGADFFFHNTARDGQWTNARNWFPAGTPDDELKLPTIADSVTIPASAQVTVAGGKANDVGVHGTLFVAGNLEVADTLLGIGTIDVRGATLKAADLSVTGDLRIRPNAVIEVVSATFLTPATFEQSGGRASLDFVFASGPDFKMTDGTLAIGNLRLQAGSFDLAGQASVAIANLFWNSANLFVDGTLRSGIFTVGSIVPRSGGRVIIAGGNAFFRSVVRGPGQEFPREVRLESGTLTLGGELSSTFVWTGGVLNGGFFDRASNVRITGPAPKTAQGVVMINTVTSDVVLEGGVLTVEGHLIFGVENLQAPPQESFGDLRGNINVGAGTFRIAGRGGTLTNLSVINVPVGSQLEIEPKYVSASRFGIEQQNILQDNGVVVIQVEVPVAEGGEIRAAPNSGVTFFGECEFHGGAIEAGDSALIDFKQNVKLVDLSDLPGRDPALIFINRITPTQFRGAGFLNIEGGRFEVGHNVSVDTNLTLMIPQEASSPSPSMFLEEDRTMTVTGQFFWDTGNIEGKGTLSMVNSAGGRRSRMVCSLSRPLLSRCFGGRGGTRVLGSETTIRNEGDMLLPTESVNGVTLNGTLINETEGVVTIESATGFVGSGRIINHGVIRKRLRAVPNGGELCDSRTSRIAITRLTNRGRVEVESGRFLFSGIFETSGRLLLASNSAMEFNEQSTLATSGPIEVAAAARLIYAGIEAGRRWELANGSTFSGNGTIQLGRDQRPPGAGRNSMTELMISTGVAASIPRLELRPTGRVGGDGSLRLTESFHWLGGELRLDGGVVSGKSLLVEGDEDRLIHESQLTVEGEGELKNLGAIGFVRGRMLVGLDATLTANPGFLRALTFDNARTSGRSEIHNLGTFRLIDSAQVNFEQEFGTLIFLNEGLIDVVGGRLDLPAGVTSGRIQGSNNAVVNLGFSAVGASEPFRILPGAEFGEGDFELALDGKINLETDVTLRNLRITNGLNRDNALTEVGGVGNLSVTDTLAWDHGDFVGPGVFTIGPNAKGTIGRDGEGFIQGEVGIKARVVNEGELVWDATGNVDHFEDQGGVLENRGVFEAVGRGEQAWAGGLIVNTGTLRKTGGRADESMRLGATVENRGLMEMLLGTLRVRELKQIRGRTHLAGGGLGPVFPSQINLIFDSGEVTGVGTLGAQLEVLGSTVENSGAVLNPGLTPNTAGVIRVENNYVQHDLATLQVDIGGRGLNEFDRLVFQKKPPLMSTRADLGGILNVSLINGFVPRDGDEFEIIRADTVRGAFANQNFPPLPGGVAFSVEQGADALGQFVKLVVKPGLENDTGVTLDAAASVEAVLPGETYDYQLRVVNNGGRLLEGVRVTNFIPFGTSFVAATDDGTIGDFGEVVWDLGTIRDGSEREVTLTVRVDDEVFTSAIENATYSLTNADFSLFIEGEPVVTPLRQATLDWSGRIEIDDSQPGNTSNGAADPDEQGVAVFVEVVNNGFLAGREIRGAVFLSADGDPAVSVADPTASIRFPDLASGERGLSLDPVVLNIGPGLVAGPPIEIFLSLASTDEDGATSERFIAVSVPTEGEAVPVTEVGPLVLRFEGGELRIEWGGVGVLESASEVEGPFAVIVGASDPFVVQPDQAQQFFRVRGD